MIELILMDGFNLSSFKYSNPVVILVLQNDGNFYRHHQYGQYVLLLIRKMTGGLHSNHVAAETRLPSYYSFCA